MPFHFEVLAVDPTGARLGRLSIPFFHNPNADAEIRCIRAFYGTEEREKYPAVRFGDYSLWFARKGYEHMANEPALPDAIVARGAPRQSALVNFKVCPTKFGLGETASR